MNMSARILLLPVLASLCLPAAGESYRWVDPVTGRKIVSDQPPPAGIKAARIAGSGSQDELPPALREPVQRFPVSLYVASHCKTPCADARNLLNARGIPFSEKATDTPAMLAELKNASGDTTIPTLMVGRQATAGFEPSGWHSLLDLAGYPERPVRGFKPPAATATPAAPPKPATEDGAAPR